MNRIPNITKLSTASKLSLLSVVILLGAVFFTVTNSLQQQNSASHASTQICYTFGTIHYCTDGGLQPLPTNYFFRPTPTPMGCRLVWTGFVYQCETPTPISTPTPILRIPTPTCSPPPLCFKNGVMICLIPQGGWCNATPTLVPTAIPTAIPTATPMPHLTATPMPTNPPVPTQTPAPGSTMLNFTVALHGIGNGGDSANPHSQGNMDPHRSERTITIDLYDAQNQLALSQQATIHFDPTSGMFTGSLNVGHDFTTGLYTVKIKTDQYLRAIVPGIQAITTGQTTTLPTVTLIAGDVNGDNAINILDYNLLMGCYSDLLPPVACNDTNAVLTDLNDDGAVNQYDYNLFLRELTNIGGQ